MAMRPPKGRDDRKDLTRTDPDSTGRKSTPGLDPNARDPEDVRSSGAEGGMGAIGEGFHMKDESKQKGPISRKHDPMRRAETSGSGDWSGRDSQRGPSNTGVGERGSGDSANQIDRE